jgi:uncharacterized UPF0146 family protein
VTPSRANNGEISKGSVKYMRNMRISFKASEEAWKGYGTFLESLASRPRVKRVCEIGGGANPALSLDFIERNKLEYVVLDISSEELAKTPKGYFKVQADITSPSLSIRGGYDLVFSRFVAEHVSSGLDFHRNVWKLLSKDGIAFHYFPTLYAPPFVINRLLPEPLAEFMVLLIHPYRTREGTNAKFPAYYSWCKGPTSKQIKKFEEIGYRVEEYIGFFGHPYCYSWIKPIAKVHSWISTTLIKHPLPWLTSFAYVVLSKKTDAIAEDLASQSLLGAITS